MIVSVNDQNADSFDASSVDDGINRAIEYAKPGDRFRVYVIDNANPYPGYIAAWVSHSDNSNADPDQWFAEQRSEITILRRRESLKHG